MPMLFLVSIFLITGCIPDITQSQLTHKTKTQSTQLSNVRNVQQTLSQDDVPIVNLMGARRGKDA